MKLLFPILLLLCSVSLAVPPDSVVQVIENYIERSDPSLPFLKVILEENISDVSICKGPFDTYYMTGTTGDQFGVQEGIKVWASKDLQNWNLIGTNSYVWTFADDAVAWQKIIATSKGWRERGIMSPKIYYFKKTFWITYTNSNSKRSGILKSTSGWAQGPWIEVGGEQPLLEGTNASLFVDADSAVYLIWENGKYLKMNADLTGFESKQVKQLKDSNGKAIDAVSVQLSLLDKRYVLAASKWNKFWPLEGITANPDMVDSRFDIFLATADQFEGPYTFQEGVIPHAGGGCLFADADGQYYHTISGIDVSSPISGQPCLIPLQLNAAKEFQVKHLLEFGSAGRMNTVYVAPSGNNSNGSSWDNAYTSLQKAIDQAPERSQIWVAAGSYSAPFSINLRKGIYIYGGFRGNERYLYQRNVEANKVILEGKGLAKHVVSIWTSTYIRLDGLTIRGGDASGGSFHQQYGGGIHILGGGETIRLVNCSFENNRSILDGGALYISVGAAPTIINCTFTNNASRNNGGAVAVYCNAINGYHCKFYNCTFNRNVAHGDGGAIYFDTNYKDYGLLTMVNCLVINNVSYRGGGALTLDRNSSLLILNGTLSNNKGTSQGAAVANLGKVPARSYLVNSIMTGNEAGTLLSIEGEAEYVSTFNKLTSPRVWVNLHHCLFDQQLAGNLVQRNFDRKRWRNVDELNQSVMGNNCLYDHPGFVDSKQDNYQLRLLAPAKNAGSSLIYFPYNIEGKPRENGKIDLGCF
ncbi:MAG: family 43 glycosylhydrolase [Prolixibacteraceae bacterium]|nr:family 43 glycosylhydrolase [Prolixibacteraceae bacterium]